MTALDEIQQVGLREWVHNKSGLWLPESITSLRTEQEDVVEWALSRSEQYLLVNAPTGVGKTLVNLVYGLAKGTPVTYAVHTIRLQQQVESTLPGMPVLTGRSNHPCLIGRRTHGMDITAQYGVCTMRQPCEFRSGVQVDGEFVQCAYYSQLDEALTSRLGRVTNYAMYLALPPVRMAVDDSTGTHVLLADEAHNIERALCSAAEISITTGMVRAAGYGWPRTAASHIAPWRGWGFGALKKTAEEDVRPAIREFRAAAKAMAAIKKEDYANWVVSFDGSDFRATPTWGRGYTEQRLLNRSVEGFVGGIGANLLATSATLTGANYFSELLGLPEGEWAYLDVDSPFGASKRPVLFSPVMVMNRDVQSEEDRRPMQSAIDTLISRYVSKGFPWGVIHSVSKKYRDFLLTESRFRGIMVTESKDHEQRVADGRPSVLVSPSVTEGWDGVDNLCRFIIIPKVPFADLSDAWTRRRMNEDARTYAQQALVSIVQGAGRGMRHRDDFCDTWILDEAWASLYRRYKDWLPKSFIESYHHNVPLGG